MVYASLAYSMRPKNQAKGNGARFAKKILVFTWNMNTLTDRHWLTTLIKNKKSTIKKVAKELKHHQRELADLEFELSTLRKNKKKLK